MIRRLLLLLLFSISLSVHGDKLKLPTTEMLGKEYYYYETKRGESLYGIARKFDWNIDELVRLNPEAASNLKKGSRLYYPIDDVFDKKDESSGNQLSYFEPEPIEHTVKKGETVYGISKQYEIPLEMIYQAYPSTKQGLKTGETLVLEQNENAKYYYYKIKPGDTLYSVAQKFNTSIETLLKDNPGLTEKKFKIGETVRVTLNSNLNRIRTKLVEEERLAKVENYKVEKDDTWSSISEKTGVEEEILKEANNSSQENPKAHEVVTVPIVETVEVEKEIEFEDPRELTSEGIREIYDSIHGVPADKERLTEVRIALILDDPSSKKDIDFTRGFLVGLSGMESTPYRIDLKVMDGRVAPNLLSENLEYYEPNLIIVTADKAFPLFLADYGNSNNVQIVNVFDLKNDLFEDNSSIVQILPPSSYLYEHLAGKIHEENSYRQLIMVGDEDESDGMAIELLNSFNGVHESVSIEDLSLYEPNIMDALLIYAYPVKKDEVGDFLQAIENIKETYPAADINIVGRTNWAALIDDYGDRFGENEIIIPARVWLDEESSDWNIFCEKYEEMFAGSPVRSFPNFAASGYDCANYFIPVVALNGGDFNSGISGSNDLALQSEIVLNRVNNWGGFINTNGYLLQFHPEGRVEKILVK